MRPVQQKGTFSMFSLILHVTEWFKSRTIRYFKASDLHVGCNCVAVSAQLIMESLSFSKIGYWRGFLCVFLVQTQVHTDCRYLCCFAVTNHIRCRPGNSNPRPAGLIEPAMQFCAASDAEVSAFMHIFSINEIMKPKYRIFRYFGSINPLRLLISWNLDERILQRTCTAPQFSSMLPTLWPG